MPSPNYFHDHNWSFWVGQGPMLGSQWCYNCKLKSQRGVLKRHCTLQDMGLLWGTARGGALRAQTCVLLHWGHNQIESTKGHRMCLPLLVHLVFCRLDRQKLWAWKNLPRRLHRFKRSALSMENTLKIQTISKLDSADCHYYFILPAYTGSGLFCQAAAKKRGLRRDDRAAKGIG